MDWIPGRRVEGLIGGRKIVVKTSLKQNDLISCNLLFIGASEKSKQSRILNEVRKFPVLTVGEDLNFLLEGGIINFHLKDEKVRLEISLPASDCAGLMISSRLLSVADVVKDLK